ncbi:MAG: GFA family protein [Thermodesulfobacteriota bacterium]
MSDEKTYEGSCFCGDVEIKVTGEPIAMGYCHCEDCRKWAAAPVNAYTLWEPNSVKFIKGQDNTITYHKTDKSYRVACKTCGGHILTDHKAMDIFDVYASIIPEFNFEPVIHVHYQETVLRIKDGLPKFKDLPAEVGGSGELIEE